MSNRMIPIWGDTIPYNSKKSKLRDMKLNEVSDTWDALMQLVPYLAGTELQDVKALFDTVSYAVEMKTGIARDTYEDIPHLVPYPVEGSDRAVLVVPGGGFAYKQSDLDVPPSGEGELTAQRLNEAGISAFVLWYRNNPYRFPVCLLDMQRAIRYMRFHAGDYGYNPDKIGCVGFSAGGYLCAAQATYMRGRIPETAGYTPDEIDQVSDRVALAGLIYPCVRFQSNINLLHATLGEDTWDAVAREQFVEEYDLTTKVEDQDPPQFISYGTEDALIWPDGVRAYRDALEAHKIEYVFQSVAGANHGYAGLPEFSYWAKGFCAWANMIFDRD